MSGVRVCVCARARVCMCVAGRRYLLCGLLADRRGRKVLLNAVRSVKGAEKAAVEPQSLWPKWLNQCVPDNKNEALRCACDEHEPPGDTKVQSKIQLAETMHR